VEQSTVVKIVAYYESIKRDLKRRLMYEYRYDKRLKTENEDLGRLFIMNQ
jgi:hypothetical protein